MNSPFHWLRRRARREAEWREELDTHQALREEWHRAHGVDPRPARSLAQRQFGGSLRALEALRAVHIARWWESFLQDCRHALRGFRKAPAFSAIAVATLALGIGSSTAVFSVVDPLLFRRLPYPHDRQLVSLGFLGPIDNNEFNVVSSYLDWRRLQTPFQSLTSMQPAADCDVQTAGAPRRISCYYVEPNLLRTFGVAPLLGRDFTAADDRAVPPVVLLSYPMWTTAFAGDPAAVGRTIVVDERPARIVGVLPAGFEMPQLGDTGLLLPERLDAARPRSENSSAFLRTFGRLREGVSIEQARQAMLPLYYESVRADVPAALRTEVRLVIRSLRDRQIHEVKSASWMLLGAVLALLLLACANIANLLLARVAARRRELALRAAIGAGRARLVRQILTESLLLGLSGGAAGCALGWALLRVFVRLSPQGMLRLEQAHVDLRVLAFAFAATVAVALLFGLAPALEQPRAEALAGRGAIGSARLFLRRFLIVAQVAISLVLLTGASLFARSLWKLEDQPLGFRPAHLVTASFTSRSRQYQPAEAQSAFFDRLEARLRWISGGGLVAFADTLPPGGSGGRPYSNIAIVGHPPVATNGGMVGFRWVSPDYFRAMGIPILAGRAFLESERTSGAGPVILSATLARRLFGHESPLGQQLILDGDGRAFPVVGVAADVRNRATITDPAGPEYYRLRMARSDRQGRSGVAILQSPLDPAALIRAVRREFADLDPTLPVDIRTMDARLDRFRQRPRFLAAVVAGFAAAGLLLAAVGLYGLLAFLVAQQTREIGVRMALGARPRDVALRVEGQALTWIAAGVAVGVAGSLALSGAIRGLLFEISPTDPLSLVLPALLLCAVGVLAAWLPSRRAASVDPVVALRCD